MTDDILVKSSTCGILAGGKGLRMGGVDKAGLMLGEHTFLDHLLQTVQCFDRILISVGRQETDIGRSIYGSSHRGYPVIPDIHQDTGPMGALEALLKACETETLLIIPCDTPLLGRETIFRMYRKLDETADAAVIRCRGKIYPTIAIYKKSILPEVEAAINSGNYRMKALLDRIDVQYMDTESADELQNINTPEELEALRQTIAGC